LTDRITCLWEFSNGTVRGRLGYVWGDGNVMSYVTGGLAYGDVKIHGTNTLNTSIGAVPSLSINQTFDHSHVNTGWVVGTGTEGKLLIPGWTYKIEGLYMDLGHLDARGVISSVSTGPGVIGTATGGQITSHTHFTDTIIRVGLNYQFH
jgi:outer membrane immunogenic protein